MHIHILGICGTFMGGLAMLAKQAGHRVTGCDENVYPPMSTQLESLGIELIQGFDPTQLEPAPDLVVIGNAMSRGNPCVEYVLNRGLEYCSGPEWLKRHILPQRWVLAVAGTHGKTSTASMLAWILEDNGLAPGFLIGGVPQNFGVSARNGETPFFVVEADEYDSAFFDKRSKFVHYQPRTLVLNNLEFDHADIFDSLKDIQRQFHHLVRIVPESGRIISDGDCEALEQVLAMGCWTECEYRGKDWSWEAVVPSCQQFRVLLNSELQGTVDWALIGEHNVQNAIMAIAAARHVGVKPEHAIDSLSRFTPPKRRMELLAQVDSVSVYDDFAHHPSAIETTLQGLRAKVGGEKIIAVLEARSNTMKMGVHQDRLAASLAQADECLLYQGKEPAGMHEIAEQLPNAQVSETVDELLNALLDNDLAEPCHIVIMSNGGFAGLHRRLVDALKQKSPK